MARGKRKSPRRRLASVVGKAKRATTKKATTKSATKKGPAKKPRSPERRKAPPGKGAAPFHGFPPSRLPLYVQTMDWQAYFDQTPAPDVWWNTIFRWSRDKLEAYRNHHFMERVAEAWSNPFYRKLWGKAGIRRGDIRSLDDLSKLPIFDSEDVKESIIAHPPFGEVCGIDAYRYARTRPLKMQTSGGTTGMARPTLFGQRDWEYNGAFIAREIYAQGGRPGDRMQIPATLSLANMGWCYYQACHHYLGIVPITTGTGIVTPSRRQLEYAFALSTNLWASFPEYLTQLAKVCQDELGRDVRELRTKMITTYLGPDLDNSFRRHLEAMWGCPVYDNYGTHEVGGVAFEAQDQDGLYLMEDVGVFEFVDTETRQPVPSGKAGDVVFTHLHRQIPLLIRYDLRDLGRIKHESGTGLHRSCYRRMDKFLGRSDQMVKIRGTNVYPMACLGAVRSDARTTGEWVCVAQRFERDGVLRDELLVRVEVKRNAGARDGLREALEQRLRSDLGVKVAVELVDEGNLPEANIGKEGKARRLVDERGEVRRS